MNFPVNRRFRSSPGRGFTLALVLSAQWAAGSGPIVKVAVGDTHGVWLKADGTVWVWGGNSQGQLGIEGDYAYVPAQVPGLIGVRDVAAGDRLAAVQNDGRTSGPGEKTTTANWVPAHMYSPKPVRVFLLSDVMAVVGPAACPRVARGRHCLGVGRESVQATFQPAQADGEPCKHSGDCKVPKAQRGPQSDGTVRVWGDHGAGVLITGTYGRFRSRNKG